MKRERKVPALLPRHVALAAILWIAIAHPDGLCAEERGRENRAIEKSVSEPTLRAIRISNGAAMRIDGILDEPDWERAPAATGFIQNEPDEGIPATERTIVKIIYDDEALYIGVRAYDSEPAEIVGHLTRRDNECPSDWIHLGIDSYNDKRTAFEFAVNPAGVKQDHIWFDCIQRDRNWDGVWDVATSRDREGWTAEFSIPFSQLRFADNGGAHSWGFQVCRQINRKNEVSYWAPVPKDSNQFIAHFGRLEGVENIPKSNRIELLPYAVGSIDIYGDPEEGDPFHDAARGSGRFGADIKYGVTSNITVDMSLNPDFGQVEQDPSEFNLTAYETYFEEKRPFFIEGSNIFRYPLMFDDENTERLFYSRRIGRPPQFYPLDSDRWPDTDDFFEDRPQFTKILGAAKITGRSSNGWSIGILEAVTDREETEIKTPDGERFRIAVEPMTNYFVGRAMKDYNDGGSTLGGIVTSVFREGGSDDLAFLNRSAVTGGLDFSHRWHDDEYMVTARISGSHVRGSEEAMLEVQESSARYFQRPDADHVEVDSSRTYLNGFGGVLWGGKFGGKPWRFGIGGITRSPGFEVNDIGYMRDADINMGVLWGGYRRFEPIGITRQFRIDSNAWIGWSYGGENFGTGANIHGWAQFNNYYELHGGIGREIEGFSTRLLRGGPAVIEPAKTFSWYGFNSDSRKRLVFGYYGEYFRADEGGTAQITFSPEITIRPSGRFDVSFHPQYTINEDDMQYVDEIDGHHVLAHLDMRVLGITTRLNYTVTPEMSVQFYGMPYIAAGTYTDYREATAPRADDYNDRFTPFDYLASADNPDFNFKEFRSNLVFRWEFSPGSAFYFVWSRGATDLEEQYGEFELGRDMDRMFSKAGDDTFLIKINKWFSL
jgi:hypothetical protein